ncbi:hypothetical protein GCM10009103_54720 [Pseudomonas koreensis]|nr:hypothetical protein GCM10009103_54720 [Pseudomonas koreensis]
MGRVRPDDGVASGVERHRVDGRPAGIHRSDDDNSAAPQDTELLLEVDEWTGFTRNFTSLKSGDLDKDKDLLLTTILADAINFGLTKMAESCPGTTCAKLA